MSANSYNDLKDREAYKLESEEFDFHISLINDKFDNFDNPYGEFKLHLYDSLDGTQKDRVIPLTLDCL